MAAQRANASCAMRTRLDARMADSPERATRTPQTLI